MIHRFELKQEGHLFRAHNIRTNDIKSIKYVVDVEPLGTEFKKTRYNLTLYKFGCVEDITIGEWTFCSKAKGEYDGSNYLTYEEIVRTKALISATSPCGDKVEISYRCKSNWEPNYIAECFINGIFLVACCNCEKDYYDTYNSLFGDYKVTSDLSIKTLSERFLSFASTIANKDKCNDEDLQVVFEWLTKEYNERTASFFESLLDYERLKSDK